MWKNGADVNDYDESVRLYEPIQYNYKGKCCPTTSWIGGSPAAPSEQKKPIICSLCDKPVPLLLQLHIPTIGSSSVGSSNPLQFFKNRTQFVYSCNDSSCWRQLFSSPNNKKFSEGGGGVVFCRRWEEEEEVESTKTTTITADHNQEPLLPPPSEETLEASPWADAGDDADEDDNDWNIKDEENTDDVEALLQKLEVNGPKGIGEKKKRKKKNNKIKNESDDESRFACYEICAKREPGGLINVEEEDTIGLEKRSDAKIQAMLARYMEDEDDPEILSALRGDSGGGNIAETEEQLPEEDRAFLSFNDRLKRSPRQIVRYAKEGTPLWSLPSSSSSSIVVPDCPCGEKRIFEFQLVPHLLQVLDVDNHAQKFNNKKKSSSDNDMMDLNEEFSSGGQNWGTIAVYTCSISCDEYPEEYVVVQDSVDSMPERRGEGKGMVVAVEMEEEEATYIHAS